MNGRGGSSGRARKVGRSEGSGIGMERSWTTRDEDDLMNFHLATGPKIRRS